MPGLPIGGGSKGAHVRSGLQPLAEIGGNARDEAVLENARSMLRG